MNYVKKKQELKEKGKEIFSNSINEQNGFISTTVSSVDLQSVTDTTKTQSSAVYDRQKEILMSFKNVFERKITFSKLHIMIKLLKLKCTSDDLQDYFMNVESLLRELKSTGATLDKSDKACYRNRHYRRNFRIR